jgi:peroxiredoxin
MKRILLVSIALLLIIFTGVIFTKFLRSLKIKADIQKEMKSIPDFKFFSMDSLEFTRDSLHVSESVIFVHYNSDCEYCISEAEQIVQNSDLFVDVKILFISDENIEQIKEFGRKYKLQNYELIKLLKDPDNSFYRNFGTSMIPSIVIYNKKGELVKEFKGETKVDALLKNLNL